MIRGVLRARDPRLGGALTVLAAYCLHQIRYALAPVAEADAAHGYLHAAPELLAVLLSLAIGFALVRVTRCRGATALPRPAAAAWLRCTLALLAILCCQELAEGHGAMLVAHGGWIVLPLAALFGLALSRVLYAAEQVIEWVAETFLRGPRSTRVGVVEEPGVRVGAVVCRLGPSDPGFPEAERAPPVADALI